MRFRFRYILPAIFAGAVLLIVFLQFNSDRSINQLINGNESLLQAASLKNELQQVQTTVASLESKVRGGIISGTGIDSNLLDEEIKATGFSYQRLRPLENDSRIAPLLQQLKELVRKKIDFNKEVVAVYNEKGKQAAEELVNTRFGVRLADSINHTIGQINTLHEDAVTVLIRKADNNARKARTAGLVMAGIAILASLFTFGYVAYKVQQQQQLIRKLNISEQKARDAARIKENFLANMSHEIRTPLNAILGFTHLLEKETLQANAKEYVQTIGKSSEHLLTIINDILDLSRIEAGVMRIEPVPFRIRELVHSAINLLQARATEKNLSLITLIDETLPDELEGDTMRLTQVLINLTGNAIKFTEKGTITIAVKNLGIENNIVRTGIEVKDEGIGIDAAKLSTIFERFQQAEESVTRTHGGTGLGLSIVKELVELQNGTIRAESEPGKGSCFYVMIPYKKGMSPAAIEKNFTPDHTTPGNLQTGRILVAEDNEINRSLIRHLFMAWNIPFDLAVNGQEAIQLLQQDSYSLVLMDIQMPVMDGYSAVTRIRQTLRSTIPVIAMTAHAMAGEKEKCLSYGMNDYISKPIRESELLQLISRYTALRLPVTTEENKPAVSAPFSCINLSYMQSVSNGNTSYEKEVTLQFIEAVPAELQAIEQAWQQNDTVSLQRLAHNMKTTVSIMGLEPMLAPSLDALEHETLTNESFQQHFRQLYTICRKAIEEARRFLESLPD